VQHIPYKGSAPAVTDLLGGQVMMMFDNIPSALPHIKAGKLRPLATTGAKRDPLLPDVPTVAEAGVPGYESGVWFGLAVPAGTPKDVIAKLNDAAVKGTKSPEFVKRMTELGYSIIGSTPEQMQGRHRDRHHQFRRGPGHAAGRRGIQEGADRRAGGGRLDHRRQVEPLHLPHRSQLQPRTRRPTPPP
jgi:tripartite-type tricarboxylate transporter receptor subunit TctC